MPPARRDTCFWRYARADFLQPYGRKYQTGNSTALRGFEDTQPVGTPTRQRKYRQAPLLPTGIFYSELLFEKNTQQIKIDSRTSDAIALALRYDCPIYSTPEIVEKAGIAVGQETGQTESPEKEEVVQQPYSVQELTPGKKGNSRKTVTEIPIEKMTASIVDKKQLFERLKK